MKIRHFLQGRLYLNSPSRVFSKCINSSSNCQKSFTNKAFAEPCPSWAKITMLLLFSPPLLSIKGREGGKAKGNKEHWLFSLTSLNWNSLFALTSATYRLISTWSCRNSIPGLWSSGQPKHVNLFSMCALRRRQTTIKPGELQQPSLRSLGVVNKELKGKTFIKSSVCKGGQVGA